MVMALSSTLPTKTTSKSEVPVLKPFENEPNLAAAVLLDVLQESGVKTSIAAWTHVN